MSWNIAQAKQQFSEMVRLSAEEPQAVYNRDKAVAVLVSAAEYQQFIQWRKATSETSLTDQFLEARAAFAEVGLESFEIKDRSVIARANTFVDARKVTSPRAKKVRLQR